MRRTTGNKLNVSKRIVREFLLVHRNIDVMVLCGGGDAVYVCVCACVLEYCNT